MQTLDQIAAQLQGYDPQALKASDVNDFLSRMVMPVRETERVGIFEALDRVLAEDLISPVNVPPHNNSAMDGFAFAGTQLSGSAVLPLKLVGTAFAGAAWRGRVGAGECLKVMTGAVLPRGLDTVVPQELVQTSVRDGEPWITVPAGLLSAGDNRRLMGEDIQQGQAALLKGCLLTPAALGLIASLGLAVVTVWRRLRVAYFSTGNEILSLGESPREGAVYDSNRYTVFGLLARLGVTLIDLGVVKDEPALLETAFMRAAREADAIITSGGVSVGEADHTKAMMQKLAGGTHEGNGGVAFWRIAMRPGRPMAVGRIAKPDSDGAAVLFGLPGNPVAVMVTFLAFVRPALIQMMGCCAESLPYLRAMSMEPIRKKPGRTEYQRGIVTTTADGSLQVKITGNQGSGVLSSMVQANGLIVLHHDQANVAAGELVDVMMFSGVI
jgi:molybdopterin molybdotransferase